MLGNLQESTPPIKFLLILLAVLGLAAGVLYFFILGNGQFPFFVSKSPVPQNLVQVSTLTDTGRIENCLAKKGEDPLVDEVAEVAPSTLEIDYRGKVKEVLIAETKTSISLISVDGRQVYNFSVDNAEPVYGKLNTKISDLKKLDEIVIAVNCRKGEAGNIKISRVIRIGG